MIAITTQLKSFTLTGCLLLTSCMVGPNYHEPIKPVVTHWPHQNTHITETPFKDMDWWQVFHDPVLTTVIQEGYHHNLDVQIAGVRVLQARAQLAQSVGELYPQQQALIGNYTYNRIGGSSLQDLLPPSFDTALLGFTANWELDFWGKYRRAILANDALFLSSLAAYDNALVTLTADIASTYIKIRTLEIQIKITKENIQVQRIGLRIARSRFNAGQTSLVDVEQAQTELSQTEGSMPSLISQLRTQQDLLAVLLGTVPHGADTLLQQGRGIPKAPLHIAVGIPKEILARRPDIHQARLETIAQLEKIGAIKANLFPSFSLAGTFAFAANNIGTSSISQLFNWSNRTITEAGGVNWPLLNYGQITNAVRAQDAVFQQSLLNYVNLVLKAQQEVQDNITNYIEAQRATHYFTKANRSAIKTLRLALVRYKEGESDFTPVLNAEQQQLRIQTSLTNAQGDIPMSAVALYRALGGGWTIRQCDDVVSQRLKQVMAKRTNWGTLLKQNNHVAPVTKKQQINQLYLPKW